MDQDLNSQDSSLQATPSDVRADVAALGRSDLFFLCKSVLNYKDITAPCHGPICVFHDQNEKQFKLILIPRDHFKTSVITVGGTIQRVVRDPNGRYLIANESATNAERMLRAIRQHAESNRIFRTIYSDIIPSDTRRAGLRWNDHELEFNREWIGPEPTVDTIGMTGAFTSRHYTHITADDLISEEAIKSEKVMKDTIERFKGFFSLLARPNFDTIMIVGTRWALHDIYSWILENLGPRLAVYATGVYNEEGNPIFPELMSVETLALKRSSMGEYRFSCLYLNNPRNEDIQDLNVKDVCYWEWSSPRLDVVTLFDNAGVILEHVPVESMDITVAVDLAPAETIQSDMNAVTTVGTTSSGRMVVLDAWAKRCKPSVVIDHLFHIHRRFHPRIVGIEGVAYQKAFKYFLKDECERRMTYISIRDLPKQAKKEIPIRGLQPIMASYRMFIHRNMTLLLNQMGDFPLGDHDDVVDSLSLHLQLMTGALSEDVIRRRQEGVTRAVSRILHPNEDNEIFWSDLTRTSYSSSYLIP